MKRIHRLTALLLAVVLLLSLCSTALASNRTKQVKISYRGIRIVVNGTTIDPCDGAGTQVEPFVLNGTTYLPVRAVAGALGLTVGWEGATSTVRLTSGGDTNYGSGTPLASNGSKHISISYRDIRIVLDGEEIVPRDGAGAVVEPFVSGGTTYLPVRAVANALGLEVGWDGATSTVTLDAPKGKYVMTKGVQTMSMPGETTRFARSESFYDDRGTLLREEFTDNYGSTTYIYYPNGEVKEETMVTGEGRGVYQYNEEGTLLREEWAYADTDEKLSGLYLFNEDGSLLERRTVYRDGTTATIVCTYNADGTLRTQISTSDEYTDTSVYTYDKAGRLLKDRTDCSNGGWSELTYTYDSKGNVLEQRFDNSGVYYSTLTNTYDKYGNLTKRVQDEDGYKTTTTYTYTYDKNGKVQKMVSVAGDLTITNTYNAKGDVLSSRRENKKYGTWVEYTYNTNGDLLKASGSALGGGTVTDERTYTAAGDLLRQTLTTSDGLRATIVNTYNAGGNLLTSDGDDGSGGAREERRTYNADGTLKTAALTLRGDYAWPKGASLYDLRGLEVEPGMGSNSEFGYAAYAEYDEHGNMVVLNIAYDNGGKYLCEYTYEYIAF